MHKEHDAFLSHKPRQAPFQNIARKLREGDTIRTFDFKPRKYLRAAAAEIN